MPRAVLDANVLISALLTPRGATARVLLALRDGAFELIVSPLLIAELERTLKRQKFRKYVTEEDVTEYVDLIRRLSVMVDDPPAPSVRLSRDPGDEYLISLARAAHADALVSGDAHLLSLRSRIPVRSPSAFLGELERNPPR